MYTEQQCEALANDAARNLGGRLKDWNVVEFKSRLGSKQRLEFLIDDADGNERWYKIDLDWTAA